MDAKTVERVHAIALELARILDHIKRTERAKLAAAPHKPIPLVGRGLHALDTVKGLLAQSPENRAPMQALAIKLQEEGFARASAYEWLRKLIVRGFLAVDAQSQCSLPADKGDALAKLL